MVDFIIRKCMAEGKSIDLLQAYTIRCAVGSKSNEFFSEYTAEPKPYDTH